MADPVPGDEFFYQKRSESTVEAASRRPFGREINMAKAALQSYITQWMLPDSPQHALLKRHAPRSSQFTIDRSGQRNVHFSIDQSWEEDDPTLRKVQVNRFFETFKERFPAILIVDGGYRNRTAGLGDIQGGRITGGIVSDFDIVTDLIITLDIIILSLDESTCSDLSVLVSSTLGPPLRRFGGGNQIVSRDPNNNWQLTLPMENDIGALSRENIDEDPANSKWSASLNLQVGFEVVDSLRTTLAVRRGYSDLGDAGGSQQEISVDQSNMYAATAPIISGPETIKVGQPVQYRLLDRSSGAPIRMSPKWKLVVSDYRIAMINPNTFVVTPRTLGDIELRLIDKTVTQDGVDGHIYSRLAVKVTP